MCVIDENKNSTSRCCRFYTVIIAFDYIVYDKIRHCVSNAALKSVMVIIKTLSKHQQA